MIPQATPLYANYRSPNGETVRCLVVGWVQAGNEYDPVVVEIWDGNRSDGIAWRPNLIHNSGGEFEMHTELPA